MDHADDIQILDTYLFEKFGNIDFIERFSSSWVHKLVIILDSDQQSRSVHNWAAYQLYTNNKLANV